jgi:hypothetical protein
MSNLKLLSETSVLQDLPEHGPMRAQVGTVVEVLSSSVAEVEFCDDQGHTYAMAELKSEELIRLRHSPFAHVE